MTRPFPNLHVVAVLFALAPGLSALAQTKPNEEMVQWIATVDAQWQATFAQEVTAVFDAEKAKLIQQYTAGLETNLTKASSAGNLDLTLVWRSERDRFAAEKDIPAEDEAASPAEMKQLRAAWRTQMAQLERDRAARTKSVHGRYDQVLGQAQTQLTQKQRLDDALLVKTKRDEIAAAWLPPSTAATPVAAAAPQMPPAATPTPSPKMSNADAASVAAVKTLVSNSRWEWFDGSGDFKGKAYWGEFYRDGTARMQWNRTPTWEVLPPNIRHIFDPADKRHWYLNVDVAKKIALKNPQLDKNNNCMRYDKKVSMPPARERGK